MTRYPPPPFIALVFYPTNCFTLAGLAAITFVGVMGPANYSSSSLSRLDLAATRERRADTQGLLTERCPGSNDVAEVCVHLWIIHKLGV